MTKEKKSTVKVDTDSTTKKERLENKDVKRKAPEAPKQVTENKEKDTVEIDRNQLEKLMARLKTVEDMAGSKNKGKTKQPKKFDYYIYRIPVWNKEIVTKINLDKEEYTNDKGRIDFTQIFRLSLLNLETGETRDIDTDLSSYVKNLSQIPAKLLSRDEKKGTVSMEIVNKIMVRGDWKPWSGYDVPDAWLGENVTVDFEVLNP